MRKYFRIFIIWRNMLVPRFGEALSQIQELRLGSISIAFTGTVTLIKSLPQMHTLTCAIPDKSSAPPLLMIKDTASPLSTTFGYLGITSESYISPGNAMRSVVILDTLYPNMVSVAIGDMGMADMCKKSTAYVAKTRRL